MASDVVRMYTIEPHAKQLTISDCLLFYFSSLIISKCYLDNENKKQKQKHTTKQRNDTNAIHIEQVYKFVVVKRLMQYMHQIIK